MFLTSAIAATRRHPRRRRTVVRHEVADHRRFHSATARFNRDASVAARADVALFNGLRASRRALRRRSTTFTTASLSRSSRRSCCSSVATAWCRTVSTILVAGFTLVTVFNVFALPYFSDVQVGLGLSRSTASRFICRSRPGCARRGRWRRSESSASVAVGSNRLSVLVHRTRLRPLHRSGAITPKAGPNGLAAGCG